MLHTACQFNVQSANNNYELSQTTMSKKFHVQVSNRNKLNDEDDMHYSVTENLKKV